MIEAVLRWEDDSDELLAQHALMETPHPAGWGSDHYAAIIDFHAGVYHKARIITRRSSIFMPACTTRNIQRWT
jgi:hypothetical protein